MGHQGHAVSAFKICEQEEEQLKQNDAVEEECALVDLMHIECHVVGFLVSVGDNLERRPVK